MFHHFLARRWAPYALIALATLAVWGHTVRFEFVWDDQQFVQELQSIRSLKNVPEMFYRLDAQSSYPEGFKLFRPLRTVCYAVLFAVGGGKEPLPSIYHAASVLWHLAAAMLLYPVAWRLFQRLKPECDAARARIIALLIALGFAVHPVVSEVVCWVKSMDDAMAVTFTLAAMLSLLNWTPERRPVWPAVGWFALAVYSKISAVPFAGFVFFLFLLVHRLSWRGAMRFSAGFAGVAIVFMAHRHLVIGQSNQTAPISGTYLQTLVDTLPTLPTYLRLAGGAPPYCIDYSYLKGGHALWSAPVLGGVACAAGAFALGVWCWPRANWRFVPLGLLWIGLFFLPVSNVLPMMQYMAERFLYLPLIGVLLLAGGVALNARRQRLIPIIGTALIVTWAALGWSRSFIWRDDLTLFVQSSQAGIRILRVEENAVAAIFKQPQVRAVFAYDPRTRTLQLPRNVPPEALHPAKAMLAQGFKLFPNDPNLASALGMACAVEGRGTDALEYFEAATRIAPGHSGYWGNYAHALLAATNLAEAKAASARATTLNPRNAPAWRTAAAVHWRLEDYEAARDAFARLSKLEPDEPGHVRWMQRAGERVRSSVNRAEIPE